MKRLVKSAIVPEGLYVTRAADRQIEHIIDEMGRPGYVLVSRQMGKTNSLIHAKNRMEDDRTKFVYIDLSTPSRTARECFRSIVDTILDSHPLVFGESAAKIALNRMQGDAPAHKEHERELVHILSLYSGRLIIILDEIDALVNSSYSDEVFAQIRSVYFSRVTFSPLKRLSYLLSGVVEPSQLIRDPKRSPFNIGEKIYLDDFSMDEVRELSVKSDLAFSEDILLKIYEWTGGHPRMTWEVSSELEDLIAQAGSVSASDVDDVVDRLYLSRFDLPPIDHIRELVRVDHEIRGALRILLSQKNPEILDHVKRKLYLAGVLKISAAGTLISIKNKVFEMALSLKWLDEVESQKDVLPSRGDEQFTLGNFEQAIGFYKQFLEERPDLSPEARWVCYLQIGLCYRRLNKFEEAIDCFMKSEWPRDSRQAEFYEVKFQLGFCYFAQEKYLESAALFNEVATGHSKSFLRCRALLNYGASIIKADDVKAPAIAEAAFQKLLGELSSVDFVDLDAPTKLRLMAWLNIAQVRLASRDFSGSKMAFEEAAQAGGVEYGPTIACSALEAEPDAGERANMLRKVIIEVEKSRLRFAKLKQQQLDDDVGIRPYSYEVFIELLIRASELRLNEEILRLIDHGIAMGSFQGGSRSEILLLVFKRIRALNPTEGFAVLLEARSILGDSPDYSSAHTREVVSLLLVEKDNRRDISNRDLDSYISMISFMPSGIQLSELDFNAFVLGVITLRVKKQYDRGIDLCLRLLKLTKNGGDAAITNTFIVHFFLAQIYQLVGSNDDSRREAEETRRLIQGLQNNAGSVIGTAGLTEIRKGIDRMLSDTVRQAPLRREMPKVGRNEQCPCGSGKKYKRCHGQ